MVSALKVGGRRLHELARAGVEVERAARPVTVGRFDVELAGPGPVLAIDVECGSGTYVRSLAADLGTLLGGGAHLRNLRRVAVGSFSVDSAVTLDELEASPTRLDAVLAPAAALPGMEKAVAGPEVAVAVGYGRMLTADMLAAAGARGPGPWAVLAEDGRLLAVYQPHGAGQAKPAVVLA
jgi:tRNA pseudouridine55 synthase